MGDVGGDRAYSTKIPKIDPRTGQRYIEVDPHGGNEGVSRLY